ncbi:MAG: endonuclease [Desulfuromonas sp.]|nr:MAG: endonuclease [Desulfuromonas sp.]
MGGASARLLLCYELLLEHFGPQGWWPGEPGFPMAVGAILTQNTAWINVERALERLREGGPISVPRVADIDLDELQDLIRPAGYFRQKSLYLKEFSLYLQQAHAGSLESLLRQPLALARAELLGRRGIGPETADAILLYAMNHPTFVVDAYAIRWLGRVGLDVPHSGYEGVRSFFLANLPSDPALFNEYHALLVALGKHYCRKNKPVCPECPLRKECPTGLCAIDAWQGVP